MKRSGIPGCWLAVLCLAPLPAWSQDTQDNTQGNPGSLPDEARSLDSLPAFPTLDSSGHLLQPRSRTDEEMRNRDGVSASDPGYQSLSAGRKAKEAGNLEEAATHFQDALLRAVPGSNVYGSAREELDFRLPLRRVENLIANEQWQEVDESLGRLLERHDSDQNKSLYLLRLISQLQERVPDDASERNAGRDGRAVMENVERTLERFRVEKGRYPNGYAELNEVLPADQDPLSQYDIVEYVTEGRAYGLTLRNKEDPDNVIKVQRTGLLQ